MHAFVLPRLLQVRARTRPGASRTRTHVSGLQRHDSMGSVSTANENQSPLNLRSSYEGGSNLSLQNGTATQGNVESIKTSKVTFQPKVLKSSNHDATKGEAAKSDRDSIIKIDESSNDKAVQDDKSSSSLVNKSSKDKEGDNGSPTLVKDSATEKSEKGDNEVPAWANEANESEKWEEIPSSFESTKKKSERGDNELPIWVNQANDSEDSDEIIPFTGP